MMLFDEEASGREVRAVCQVLGGLHGGERKTPFLPGVKEVDVDFTFDPPWSPDKMTDEARADLGLD